MAALLRRSPILTHDQLRDLVAQGDVDTVLTVFPDFYGRLVGKRIVGRYFCDEVLNEGMHVCHYLLACDMEMDPVPGYRFASWEQGYGDIRCVPDLSTLRRATWLEHTAIVLCDVVEEEGNALVSVAPRTILKRKVERAAAAGVRVMTAPDSESFVLRDSYAAAEAKPFHNLRPSAGFSEASNTSKAPRLHPPS